MVVMTNNNNKNVNKIIAEVLGHITCLLQGEDHS